MTWVDFISCAVIGITVGFLSEFARTALEEKD